MHVLSCMRPEFRFFGCAFFCREKPTFPAPRNSAAALTETLHIDFLVVLGPSSVKASSASTKPERVHGPGILSTCFPQDERNSRNAERAIPGIAWPRSLVLHVPSVAAPFWKCLPAASLNFRQIGEIGKRALPAPWRRLQGAPDILPSRSPRVDHLNLIRARAKTLTMSTCGPFRCIQSGHRIPTACSVTCTDLVAE